MSNLRKTIKEKEKELSDLREQYRKERDLIEKRKSSVFEIFLKSFKGRWKITPWDDEGNWYSNFAPSFNSEGTTVSMPEGYEFFTWSESAEEVICDEYIRIIREAAECQNDLSSIRLVMFFDN